MSEEEVEELAFFVRCSLFDHDRHYRLFRLAGADDFAGIRNRKSEGFVSNFVEKRIVDRYVGDLANPLDLLWVEIHLLGGLLDRKI